MKVLCFMFVSMFVFCAFSPLAYGQFDWATAGMYWFPVMVVGGGYTTNITITNLQDTVTEVNLYFGDQKGNNFTVKLTDKPTLVWDDAVGYNPGGLQPMSSRQMSLGHESQTAITGYVMALIPKTLTGEDWAKVSVTIWTRDGQATVSPVAPMKSFGFYAKRSGVVDGSYSETGIAIVNPNILGNAFNTVAANCTMTRHNVRGVVMESFTLEPIAPGEQVSKFMSQYRNQTIPFEGLIDVRCNTPVVATTLETTYSPKNFTFSTGLIYQLPK